MKYLTLTERDALVESRDFWRLSYEEESELRGEAQAEVERLRKMVKKARKALR